jgi:hypothetical protein
LSLQTQRQVAGPTTPSIEILQMLCAWLTACDPSGGIRWPDQATGRMAGLGEAAARTGL